MTMRLSIACTLALALGGGSKASNNYPAIGTLKNALPGASDVQTLFKGIPQNGLTLGNPKAPVTVVEYIDLQCPFCQQFDPQILLSIITKYVKTGKVKVELRVLDFIGPDSSRGRKAMLAAGSQNRAFNYAEILYFNQGTENTGWLSEDMVASAAASIPGLDVPKLLERVSVKIGRACYDPIETSFYLGRESLVPPERGNIFKRLLLHLFVRMHKNELDVTSHLGLPPNRVVELGARLDLVAR